MSVVRKSPPDSDAANNSAGRWVGRATQIASVLAQDDGHVVAASWNGVWIKDSRTGPGRSARPPSKSADGYWLSKLK